MAETKVYYFAGKCKWAMVHRKDEKYDNFKIDVYMDEPSLELYRNSGLQMKIKEDEDGKFVTFRRPDKQLIGEDIQEFGKPRVVDDNNHELNRNVGNGSDVVVKVQAFDTRNGVGHRLDGVMVTELVPYGESETHRPEGLDDIPEF